LDQYSVLLQIATFEGKGFVDELIHMERGSGVTVSLEVRANAFDHLSRTMAIRGDAFEQISGSIEIGCRTIEEPKAGISACDHCGQRLLDLMDDRRCDGVPSH